MMFAILLALAVIGGGLAVPLLSDELEPKTGDRCGYDSCPHSDPGVLNVHIVPHTHDDVGWLKTVDQYYYGSRNNIQKAGVQYILDSVIKELWQDKRRRFMYVETAFFFKWWSKQSDHVRHKVHTLVREGRLQFVGGAWSMNDEAATHYQSTIDQFTWGLSKLNETFGACGRPTVGWQIDPFGHAREFANLLSGMGYDGLFLGRIDYQDKLERKQGKTMEMLWRGDDVTGKTSDIFTGVLYNTYSPPPGFCFDVLCNDEPIVDDPDSPMYNVDERIGDYLKYVTEQAKYYRTKNVIMTMGGDFTYQDAAMWYNNLDKLIEYANMKAAKDGLNVKLFYSTPNCYLKAVKDANPTLPTKQDDFFPYASDPTAYWTGYFTSRPTTKYFEREGNAYLQMVKQLQVLADLQEHNKFVINELKSAMGVMQHHDAITGTEKQHVTYDYERLLNEAIEDALIVAKQAFTKYTQSDPNSPPILDFARCHLNESRCVHSESNDKFVVTVYNPVATTLKYSPVRVPVPDGAYSVYGPDGKMVKCQHVPIPAHVFKIPNRNSKATQEVVFLAENLKGLSYKSYFVQARKNVQKREAILDKLFKKKLGSYYNLDQQWQYMEDGDHSVMRNEGEELRTEQSNTEGEEPVLKFTKKLNEVESDADRYSSKHESNNLQQMRIELGPMGDKTPEVNEYNDRVEILEESIREARKKLEDIVKDVRPRVGKQTYRDMSENEMRMLSDDPMIVERFDHKSEKNSVKIETTDNGIRATLQNHEEDTPVTLLLAFAVYPGCLGDNREYANRSSGAYIFRPNASDAEELNMRQISDTSGPIVTETVYGNENFTMAVRYYAHLDDEFEVDWIVGPIPVEDGVGKEVVIRYETNIVNHGEFFTDSNGRQLLKRKLNQRPQYNVSLEEPIAGNYYPIANQMHIKDNKGMLTVYTDRSQGGSSLREGVMEVMLHRRLLHDDAFGVGEALNETVDGMGLIARGKHTVKMNFAPKKNQRRVIPELHTPPQIFVSAAEQLDLDKWTKLNNEHGWLKQSMPDGIHLLTLESWGTSNLLLRLENCFEDAPKPAEVDLSGLFDGITVKSYRETTLAANQWLDEYNKWSWNKENEFSKSFNEEYGSFDAVPRAREQEDIEADSGFTVKLKPGQIRTFIVNYEYNKN